MRGLVTACALLALAVPAAQAQQSSSVQSGQIAPGQYLVFFPFDEATLSSADRTVIGQAVQDYRNGGSTNITVRGHTDTAGSASYNQALSERRADAVVDELVQLGVPSSSINSMGLGETDLLVQTGDGVREQRNRRAEINVVLPVAPAPATPVAEAPRAPAPPPEPEPTMSRGIFSLGALYGFNLRDDSAGTNKEDKESHLAGVNLSFDYSLTNWLALSLEQAAFYNFFADDEGFGGRTAAGLNLTAANLGTIVPYIGGNVGYLYGKGLSDDWFAGPEIGLNLGIFNAKVAYDIPFDRDWDEGIVLTTVGLGIRF